MLQAILDVLEMEDSMFSTLQLLLMGERSNTYSIKEGVYHDSHDIIEPLPAR